MNPLSGVLGEAWALYKRHAAHFLLISFAIYLVIAVITALLSLVMGSFGAIVGGLLSLLGTFLLQAALVKAVQDAHNGRHDLDLRASVEAALPFLLPVTIAGIFASIAIGVGFALLIVPGLILLTFLSLIVPHIVLGGSTAFESFGKSWATVRGYAWHVFGTYVLVFIILIVGEFVVGIILLALPNTDRNFISDVVVGTLVAPFLAAVVTLVYDRLTAAHGQRTEAAGPQGTPSVGDYGQHDGG
ncbi:MAG TPA: hypothetical protein VHZ33_32610 [Trebonia sp.]|jgi:hypothetical protein|nr:hypothetical protein [Trebonia sp.]